MTAAEWDNENIGDGDINNTSKEEVEEDEEEEVKDKVEFEAQGFTNG